MDSRTGLLQSALTLFAARGYDGVGVQESCRGAGVAKPTLYHFFGSKLGLLEALFSNTAARLDSGSRRRRITGDLPLTLDRIFAAYIDFATAQPTFYRRNWLYPLLRERAMGIGWRRPL